MKPLYKIKIKPNTKSDWQYVNGDWREFRLVEQENNATRFNQDDLNDVLVGLNPKQIVIEKVI